MSSLASLTALADGSQGVQRMKQTTQQLACLSDWRGHLHACFIGAVGTIIGRAQQAGIYVLWQQLFVGMTDDCIAVSVL